MYIYCVHIWVVLTKSQRHHSNKDFVIIKHNFVTQKMLLINKLRYLRCTKHHVLLPYVLKFALPHCLSALYVVIRAVK